MSSLSAQTFDAKRVQDYIDARVDRELNQSIIVGVISLSGEKYFTAGEVSAKDPRPPKPEDVFEIGAVTDIFTATAAASLVVDRQITWMQPVNAYLPEYVGTPHFGHLPLQLVHLVTHTSGLPHNPPNLQPKDVSDPFADFTNDHTYVAISVIGLTIPPGSEYRFSMLGYGLLGHVLTLRTGQTFNELIQTRVSQPLTLQDTTAVLDPAKMVPGHQGLQEVPNWHWDGLAGGGGLYSSARDLLRLTAANMSMIKLDKDDERAVRTTQNVFTKTSMPNTMIGYGWHVTRKALQAVYWQNGKTGGYAAFVGFNPSTKTGCVVLTNSAQGLDDVGFYILDPEQYPLPKPPPSGLRPAKQLMKYEGTYQVGPDAKIDITRDGEKLYAQIPGQPRYRVYPVGKNEFAYATGDVRIIFDDSKRGVNGITMLIGLKKIQGKRIK
ncbi:serine hydrolase [Cerasicoccus arenae]|uniref:serine hydrolase n=1 Tax=Cerasicoccus arenae TaxID=424488 RepID=UPI001679A952|nr:serine hydrolase [Cerasicoccus arenae]MBK1859774.1 serine hydrolase [Cerasicoccus arenae]